jgi:hypothetical protein
MNIADTEKEYLENHRKQSRLLIEAYQNASQNNFFFDSIEITKAIIRRMIVYYQVQEEIKKLLNKRYAAPAADYFVESVVYFIKLSLQISNSKLQVFSERAIRKNKNSIRPDISIWNKNKVIAIIECKTQLGWNRNNWETDFRKREKKLIRFFPKAKAYLLVMTGKNWDGFNKENLESNKYCCLLNTVWPTEIIGESFSEYILTPIEPMIREILSIGQQSA